jgi:hypothetical protein
MKLAIIGCGRSGTTRTQQIISKHFDFGHECLKEHGGVGWNLALDRHWYNIDESYLI